MRDIIWATEDAEGHGAGPDSFEAPGKNVLIPTAPMEEMICDRLYLQELLGQLTPFERELVTLRAEGAPYPCIAKKFCTSVGEIKTALDTMRRRLESQGYSIAGRDP